MFVCACESCEIVRWVKLLRGVSRCPAIRGRDSLVAGTSVTRTSWCSIVFGLDCALCRGGGTEFFAGVADAARGAAERTHADDFRCVGGS